MCRTPASPPRVGCARACSSDARNTGTDAGCGLRGRGSATGFWWSSTKPGPRFCRWGIYVGSNVTSLRESLASLGSLARSGTGHGGFLRADEVVRGHGLGWSRLVPLAAFVAHHLRFHDHLLRWWAARIRTGVSARLRGGGAIPPSARPGCTRCAATRTPGRAGFMPRWTWPTGPYVATHVQLSGSGRSPAGFTAHSPCWTGGLMAQSWSGARIWPSPIQLVSVRCHRMCR
jgi:hypothetical protein